MLVTEDDIRIDPDGNGLWEINLTGKIGGTYQGLFKFRSVLSPIQQISADREYRELLGKNAELVSTHIENYAVILTQLKQRIIEAPPFWNDGASAFPGSHIRDDEVLDAVFRASVMAETKYRKQLTEKHKQSIERLKAAIQRQEEEEKLEADLDELDQPKKKTRKKKAANV